MMKLTRVFSTALLLFIFTTSFAYSSTSFSQVRNSLWVFGVGNDTTTEVEMVQQGMIQLSKDFGSVQQQDDASVTQRPLEVPEELNLAIVKFES